MGDQGGPLVLVVDDDGDTRDLYRVVLESAEYKVEDAGSLGAAVRAVEHCHPDLVLSDWLLPDGDGLVLSRELRARATSSRTPLLAITGLCMTPDQLAAAHQAGFSRVLEKPVTPSMIVDAVRELLEPAAAPSRTGDSPR